VCRRSWMRRPGLSRVSRWSFHHTAWTQFSRLRSALRGEVIAGESEALSSILLARSGAMRAGMGTVRMPARLLGVPRMGFPSLG
jgi:hypothetical protein